MAKKEKITVWHKPNCAKSIETMRFLKEHKVVPAEIVLYLEDIPTEDMIRDVLKKLGITAEELIRKKEPIYKEKFEGKKMTEEKWIKAMMKYPILIQRPIVIKGDKAVFGRSEDELNQVL
ncbi:MAG TPA: ArsC/Spx/MgsR family protein [Bacteroidia bacterium]|nr:ArsC/Spx/MgsR family protein [Bacteroidia bacterium]